MRLTKYLEITKENGRAFATRCGLHWTTVHKYMRGGTMPRLKELVLLERVTGGAVQANDFVEHYKEIGEGRAE